MKPILLLSLVLATSYATGQVTAPELLQDPAGGEVTACASPRFPLKPETSGRSVQLYSEQKSDEDGQRFYLCLFVGGAETVSITMDFEKVFDEKGTERPAKRRFASSGSYSATRLSLEEIKEAGAGDMAFTFHGQTSQVDVRLPSSLASNFLTKCEGVYGKLSNATQLTNSTFTLAERPKTLAQARLAKAKPGKQSSATHSNRGTISFDTKATPFGDYDLNLIHKVEQTWQALRDEHQGTTRMGKVTVEFNLSQDGEIAGLKVQENEVGEIQSLLCQSAILNSSPYPRWPAPMRQMVAGKYREIRFTFHYH